MLPEKMHNDFIYFFIQLFLCLEVVTKDICNALFYRSYTLKLAL